ncbi:MAG: ABC transporter ATP-binding protein [Anaerolineae bacterium]|nr:ABC transporter ATP-binding protein [Anaerolineae bacterium]
MDSTDALVRTEGLRRHYLVGGQTIRALDGVDLAIQRGEFVAVMGPSGSGKSTLLYLLGGLDRPTGGQIWVDGRALDALPDEDLAAYRGRQMGFVFQSFHLIPTMTALQNVAFPMCFARVPAHERHTRARARLEEVGLCERADHRPTELSGGQQQRVAIARALVNDPSLILADEPTGNLDSHTGQEIMELLVRLNRQGGRTIVIVSHDPAATTYATRAIRLVDGRIVEDRRMRGG